MRNERFRPLILAALTLGAFAVLPSCGREGHNLAKITPTAPPHPPGSTELRAVAQLEPTENHRAQGTVRFVTDAEGVRVVAEVSGLTPGEHGIHIHENGDCSAADASSAGGHFNPTDQPHGPREADARHVGDLGNIVADSSGRARLDYVDSELSLVGPRSIIGRAVIVHSGRDDLTSQPSGNSGARVACGEIEVERKNR